MADPVTPKDNLDQQDPLLEERDNIPGDGNSNKGKYVTKENSDQSRNLTRAVSVDRPAIREKYKKHSRSHSDTIFEKGNLDQQDPLLQGRDSIPDDRNSKKDQYVTKQNSDQSPNLLTSVPIDRPATREVYKKHLRTHSDTIFEICDLDQQDPLLPERDSISSDRSSTKDKFEIKRSSDKSRNFMRAVSIDRPATREVYKKHIRNHSANIFKQCSEATKIRCIFLCEDKNESANICKRITDCLFNTQSMFKHAQLCDIKYWEKLEYDGDDNGFNVAIKEASDRQNNPLEYFRFVVDLTEFQFLVISKDQRDLVDHISNDFLLLGAHVNSKTGEPDMNKWESEWESLDTYSNKSLAPIILVAYLTQKLNSKESKEKLNLNLILKSIRRIGIQKKVIPRLLDLATESSFQLEKIIVDIINLYEHPGYVLQQCAYNNNKAHLSRLIQSHQITFNVNRRTFGGEGKSSNKIRSCPRNSQLLSIDNEAAWIGTYY